MTDIVDQMLRDHAESWIAVQAPPPSLPEAVRACQNVSPRRPIRTYLAIAAAVVTVILIAACALIVAGSRHDRLASGHRPTSTTPTSAHSPTPRARHASAPAPVIAHARELARVNEDPAATGHAVKTTYRIARQIVFDHETSTPPGDTPVWVVELRGAFTCVECHSGPSAGRPPKYTAILFTVDASTFATYDTMITTHPRKLAKAGHVIRLPR